MFVFRETSLQFVSLFTRSSDDLNWVCLIVCLFLESFGTFRNLLENGGRIWVWNWIWVKFESNLELNLGFEFEWNWKVSEAFLQNNKHKIENPFAIFFPSSKHLVRSSCFVVATFIYLINIDEINNNWINSKCHQIAFGLARWQCSWSFLGNPGQTKVMRDCTV